VTATDRSDQALEQLQSQGIATHRLDSTDEAALQQIVREHDVVVTAVPGALGYETLRRVIDAGKDVVDISFFPEDALQLDALARERGVRAIVDAGVAPGLSNLILGYLNAELDETESFACMVGGLPIHRQPPWEYKAPFSPADVVEEYIRPVHLRRNGEHIQRAALDELELVELPGVGTLEAFLTDGLRTLLHTTNTPTLVEKTLRYPGYVAKIKMLKDSGFFDAEPIQLNGVAVRPLDLTTKLLDRVWFLGEGEEELTVMRVEIVGRAQGRRVRHVFDLLDRYDVATRTSSMARTTGYTCTAMVRWLAGGSWTRPGIAPPEVVGADKGCFEFVRAHLEERGVQLTHAVEVLA
jgi:saccharopine dehydrogenase-like NADP-dependent oxidoreductase